MIIMSLMQIGIEGWSKTMIGKQRVPGSSPVWKRNDFSSHAATHS